jgi:hypothetical protein
LGRPKQRIGRIKIVFSRNSHQRKQRVTSRIGKRSAMRWGAAVSLDEQTGQSDEIHSPDA